MLRFGFNDAQIRPHGCRRQCSTNFVPPYVGQWDRVPLGKMLNIIHDDDCAVRTFLIRRPTRPRSRPPALTAPSSRSVGSAGMAMIASLFTGVTPSYRQKPNHISAINVCGMLAASFSGTKSGSFSQGGFNQLGRFGDNRKQHTVSHINFSSLLPAF